MATAYFAGGCFWCITPIFNEMDGVSSVVSGYSGGDEQNPKYEDVKSQKTGHRETIKIEYDETKVSFSELLGIFVNSVDPFDDGGQFIDRGFSYTLAIYYSNDAEKEIAEAKVKEVENFFGKKPCIAVEPFKTFFDAEEYHQDYYKKNPGAFEKELIESGRKKAE